MTSTERMIQRNLEFEELSVNKGHPPFIYNLKIFFASMREFLVGIDGALIKSYSWILLPLVVTQLLQRMEYIVDNRFISQLGPGALLIHSVNFNFFLVAQAIGLAAATSALIFWKREEYLPRQRGILRRHVQVSGTVGFILAIFCFPCLYALIRGYHIAPILEPAAHLYLSIGLVNMVLAAIYMPLNALLIASDQRVKSLVNIVALIGVKIAAGNYALAAFGRGADISHCLLIIGLGGSLAIIMLSVVAWRDVSRRAQDGDSFEYSDMRSVWQSEMGTALIRSLSPFIYTYLLAQSLGGSSIVVTYQLALHLAYILTLPQLAGSQIAIRDASMEESMGNSGAARGLLGMDWFRWFFAVSVVPTQLLLVLGATNASTLMRCLYKYSVPPNQVAFLSIYFCAVAVGQVGNIYMVLLRGMRRNEIGTRNFLISEIGIQVVLTGVAVSLGSSSPALLGLIVLAYCFIYLLLNLQAVTTICA